MTPSCSPLAPIMTRTSRARIRPFTRICGCRLDLSPQQQNGSAPRRRISFIATSGVAFANAKALFLRHGCDSPQRSARIKVREPKRSCRQQFRAGKVNLVTIRCRSPQTILPVGRQSALCALRMPQHRLALNRLLQPMAQVSPLQKKWHDPRSPYQLRTRVVA